MAFERNTGHHRVQILFLLGIVALTKTVAAQSQDRKPPVITHVKVTHAPIGEAIVIRARIEDENEVFAPSVYVRSSSTEEYLSISMRKVMDGYEATIPAEMVSGTIDYFIEAFDEEGNGPSREGLPNVPNQIETYDPAKGPPPIAKREPPKPGPDPKRIVPPIVENGDDEDGGVATKWWFWTLIGVAVTGGITATVLLTRNSGPVDIVDIEVIGPDPSAGL